MRSASVALAIVSVLLVLPVATAQTTLDCSTIPGASNYGTDLSVCHMPDQSTLKCSQDKFGMSNCEVDHANGFTSGIGQGSAGEALGGLIAWMIHNHQQHVTDKAINDASSTVVLVMKHTMHLTDLSTLLDRLAPYLPAEQREPMVRMSKDLAGKSSAFSGAVSSFNGNWNNADRSSFLRESKRMHNLYDSGLLAVCTARLASQVLTGKLDTVRANLTEDLVKGLDAVHADETLLEPECGSPRAIKLLQKQQSIVRSQ